MVHDSGQHDSERESALPADLTHDLESLYGTAEVPESVDDAVFRAARDHFASMPAEHGPGGFTTVIRKIGLVGAPLAAAAVLAMVVWLTPWQPGAPQGPVPLPGTPSPQAKGMLQEKLDQEMGGDRLAFAESETEEMFRFADGAGVAGASIESADEGAELDTLATLADAAPAASRADLDNEVRARAMKAGRRAAAPAEARRMWTEDFNKDGVVDMRDALEMARVLKRGPWSMGMQWDLNGDGRVDDADVSAVALAAVDLERRGEVIR